MPSEGLPSPSEVFITGLTREVNKEDVNRMSEEQEHMMARFEKTNEMLLNFNMLSAARFEATHHEFKKHTRLLLDMKKDLDTVFKRTRALKSKLCKQHPDAFKSCSDVFDEGDEDDEETSGADSQSSAAAGPSTSSSKDGDKAKDAGAAGETDQKAPAQNTEGEVVSDTSVVQEVPCSESSDAAAT